MVTQLVIGTIIITITVMVAAGFAGTAVWALARFAHQLVRPPHGWRFVIALGALVLWVQLAMSICVWLWALLFLYLEIFATMEPALYFSIVSFTTLGFGDILLPDEWRILSGLSAANGLLMFGFFTAFLVEMMRRIRREQVEGVPEVD